MTEAARGHRLHYGDDREAAARHLIVGGAVPRPLDVGTDPGLLPGFALLRNGQCCEDKIYLELGVAAEAAAWWQHNNAPSADLITVGAISELAILVPELRLGYPGRDIPGQPRFFRPGWADPGPTGR